MSQRRSYLQGDEASRDKRPLHNHSDNDSYWIMVHNNRDASLVGMYYDIHRKELSLM